MTLRIFNKSDMKSANKPTAINLSGANYHHHHHGMQQQQQQPQYQTNHHLNHHQYHHQSSPSQHHQIQYFQYPSNSTSVTPVNASPLSSSLTSSPSTTNSTPIQYHHINNFNYVNHMSHQYHSQTNMHNALTLNSPQTGANTLIQQHHQQQQQQQQQFQQLQQLQQFHSFHPSSYKDTRWLTLEVCREFQRNKCNRTETECKFAHPPAHVEIINGKVIACYDSLKVRSLFRDSCNTHIFF